MQFKASVNNLDLIFRLHTRTYTKDNRKHRQMIAYVAQL